jgi:hypothetical protein
VLLGQAAQRPRHSKWIGAHLAEHRLAIVEALLVGEAPPSGTISPINPASSKVSLAARSWRGTLTSGQPFGVTVLKSERECREMAAWSLPPKLEREFLRHTGQR